MEQKIAIQMAQLFGNMLAQTDGVLSATDDPIERGRLENASSALQSVRNFYIMAIADAGKTS